MTGAGVRTKIAITVRDGFHGSQVLTVTAGGGLRCGGAANGLAIAREWRGDVEILACGKRAVNAFSRVRRTGAAVLRDECLGGQW